MKKLEKKMDLMLQMCQSIARVKENSVSSQLLPDFRQAVRSQNSRMSGLTIKNYPALPITLPTFTPVVV
ncbi:hypothetical protein AAHC03_05443 [Spirometra sp. Aus1]